MYNKVLVAIDLSEQSDKVLAKARQLIELHQCDYQVVFAYEQPVFPWGELAITLPPIDFNELRENIASQFKATVAKSGLDGNKTQVIDGMVAEAILEQAQTTNADLIVIGSHGVSGFQVLLGSTADKILHHAVCDVLAVRVKPI